jgi:hypothetical protein
MDNNVSVAASIKPPAIQGDVIALFGTGVSKRSIARQLQIDRATVDRILKAYSQDKPISAGRIQQILPKAYDAVEKAVTGGDAKIAMDLLKLEHSQRSSTTYNVAGDLSLSTASLLMPTITPVSTERTGTELAAPTEAAAKPTGSDLSVSLHTNFSQFSDEQLEQELARRRAARSGVIDAEVVPDGSAR